MNQTRCAIAEGLDAESEGVDGDARGKCQAEGLVCREMIEVDNSVEARTVQCHKTVFDILGVGHSFSAYAHADACAGWPAHNEVDLARGES